MTTVQSPAAATAAPTKPPTSAWLELLGNPQYHVARFQTIAPSNAQISTSCVTMRASTRPEAIVFATAVPHSAPIRFVDGGHHHGLPRREHLRRDDRGDRVGRVVKAVDVLEHQGDQDHAQD